MTSAAQQLTIATKNFDIPALLLVPQAPLEAAETAPDADGVTFDAPTRWPALIVLHDIYGLDEVTHTAARRLSKLGYLTLTPDLYAASGGPKDPSDEKALANYTQTLSDSRLISDVLAALQWLAQREDVDVTKLGIIGWGWGGAYALMTGAYDPRLRVVLDIGGEITYPVLSVQKPGSPLNFVANLEGTFFAAFPGADTALPGLEIERLAARLREHDKRGEVKVYPDAPARFWRDENAPQTAQLWRRLKNFLQDNLLEFEASDEPIGDYPNEESRLHA